MDYNSSNQSSPIDKYGKPVPGVAVSSGYVESTGQIRTSRSLLDHMVLVGDGTNEATATLYNGTDNSGDVLMFAHVDDTGRVGGGVRLKIDAPDGIYAEITGTGGKLLVHTISP